MSKAGFDNETEFIKSLNNKLFGQININLKKFLVFAISNFIDDDELIEAKKEVHHGKADVIVTVGDRNSFRVSLKIGSGNSVHQERIDEFIDFLKEKYSLNQSVEKDIRFFYLG